MVQRVLDGKHRVRQVTLAEVKLNDGQRLLAFNDLFVGCGGHVSARYTLQVQGASEPQSSSGLLIATGAGSTGWLSSIFNMTAGVGRLLGTNVEGASAFPGKIAGYLPIEAGGQMDPLRLDRLSNAQRVLRGRKPGFMDRLNGMLPERLRSERRRALFELDRHFCNTTAIDGAANQSSREMH